MVLRWAKTPRPSDTGNGEPFHLLAHHGLDVAAVIAVALDTRPSLLDHFARLLGLGREDVRRLVLGLATLHDIGKVATAFQLLDAAVARRLGLGPDGAHPYGRGHGHDILGHLLLLDLVKTSSVAILPGETSVRPADIAPLWAAFSGHHGRQAVGWQWAQIKACRQLANDDIEVAAAFGQAAFDLHGRPSALPAREASQRASYLLNGLVTVADWLGSDDRYFPFRSTPMPLADYWAQHALPGARRVIEDVGPSIFRHTRAAPPLAFASLFAHLAADAPIVPTPMQAAVERLVDAGLPDGPLLLVIEDMTGAGKTEAADFVAQRLIAAGRAEGLYVGLPTMATADRAFARKREVARKIFAEEPSQVLAHGQARSRRTVRLVESRAKLEPGDPAAVAWLASSSRRALLADLGVGTVDQVLIGAVRTPHATVRLAGLWRKVLIVDEVHAYDDYMQTRLTQILKYHAAMGGIAVLLSATLPSRQRAALLSTFAKGAGWAWGEKEAAALPARTFPFLTLAHAAGPLVEGVAHAPSRRAAPISIVPAADSELIRRRLLAWAQSGRSAIWFRNTVDDAREAFETLREDALSSGLPEPLLYHARFLPADRAIIEAELETVAGKGSLPEGRRSRIVVATQVAEQSLDLDFDEMASDLAPVDVLLQRLGRRRRHPRKADGAPAIDRVDARADDGEVLVLAPPLGAAGGHWYRSALPRASFVYADDARLWRTLELLMEPDFIPERSIEGRLVPDLDLKPLIEAVYASSEVLRDAVPSRLHARHLKAEGTAMMEAKFGRDTRLSFERGLYEDWGDDATIPATEEGDAEAASTRLGENARAILLERRDGSLAFLGDGDPDTILDRSECRHPQLLRPAPLSDAESETLGTKLSRSARRRLARSPAIVLERDLAGGWYGVSCDRQGKTSNVRYDRRIGLQVASEGSPK